MDKIIYEVVFIKTKTKVYFLLSFVLYLIVLVWVVLLKYSDIDSLEDNYHILKNMGIIDRLLLFIVPFKSFDFRDILLNIILFIPFGFLILFLKEDLKIYHILLIGFEASFCFEVIQLLTLLGGFSTSDIISNILGTVFGFILFKIIISKESKKNMFVANMFVMILLIPFSLFAISSFIKYFSFYYDLVFKIL